MGKIACLHPPLGVFFLDGIGSGTGKRPPGTILGIPFLAFGVVDNTKRVLDLSWSKDQRPDASSRVCVGSPGRPWSVPWSVPGVECRVAGASPGA